MIRNKSLIICGLSLILLCQIPAKAAAGTGIINWDCLDLSSKQKKQINILDKDWQTLNSDVRPGLLKDQANLKLMLNDPNSSDDKIRELQWKILSKQQMLRYEAMENFLSKRRLLSPKQRVILQQMLSQ